MATNCGPGSCGPGYGWEWCCVGWRKACSPTARSHNGDKSMYTELRPAFRRRFHAVTWQIWSLHVGRGVARTAVAAAVLLASAAAVDYIFEWSWPARAGLLAACTALVAVLAVRWVVRPARAWNRALVA